jgi:hypothetical protein
MNFFWQILKPTLPPPPAEPKTDNPFAIARPKPSDLMMQRQTSFKGFGK